jgi:hypothetical protein
VAVGFAFVVLTGVFGAVAAHARARLVAARRAAVGRARMGRASTRLESVSGGREATLEGVLIVEPLAETLGAIRTRSVGRREYDALGAATIEAPSSERQRVILTRSRGQSDYAAIAATRSFNSNSIGLT